jgi:hypothetical protein
MGILLRATNTFKFSVVPCNNLELALEKTEAHLRLGITSQY